ncbi:hypothetical protein PS627_03727 [Pseudomonas fluorescens]|uniref:pyrroloquinoline quinone biosynthesis protein PqqF n=1 Tax=Pseudomonas fluorescens TaxID=294 RepID=UPI001258770D|nr:pyrroloquinoline quinone biosynthesis protein PqqF [Pseudomonas fluorescens]CAG8869906.1 hypothetical protein PS627_03727 [Pseudomonas fluorescens]VVP98287.1 hypothetical protein PS910_03552 [Pseudomonas fluorescens]
MPDTLRHLTLDNGLQLTLRHAPRLKRCAAALRVSAGSHDAPTSWPGLAHFLEHLFFLGTVRFPLEDGLMRFVQNQGGQVNASTRERYTDFFFEVQPAALEGGLARLCQMLAEPHLGIERQRREREVIHAEFIAWSRSAQAQRQFALLQAVSPRHPLSGFHAGNRHSLTLQDPAFQHALQGFHQRFYRAGQMTLSLCGPQPLEALEALGREYGSLFAEGQKVAQSEPPVLVEQALDIIPQPGELDLLFAHECLPEGAQPALELLTAWLEDSRPGGWVAALRQQGWLRGHNVEVLYAFAGQLLWHVQVKLEAGAPRDEVRDLLHGWFGALRQADAAQLNLEFARLQRSREQAASALELARRDTSGQPFKALDQAGLGALRALLDDLPQRHTGHWQLPGADPLLMIETLERKGAPLPTGLTVSALLPSSREYGALYLRWQISSSLRQRLHDVLERGLRPLTEQARRASVQLQFSASGNTWQLRCAGSPTAVLQVVEAALTLLGNPPAASWREADSAHPPLIPIRALLKRLPDAILDSAEDPQPAGTLAPSLLDSVWQDARWQGLAIGFGELEQRALGAALGKIPGQPAAPASITLAPGRRWRICPVPGSEQALLLFCPVPPAHEAAGRLLAQLLQGPVYQRLRVELQLGYAVFSAFRQIEGRCGLLFGVQSHSASHGEILAHLEQLLHGGVRLDRSVQESLAAQFNETAMANPEAAEWAWQTYLATQGDDLGAVGESILALEQQDVTDLLQRLLEAEWGWLCFANGPAPGAGWHP